MGKALIHVAPEAISEVLANLPLVEITGTRDCHGVCVFEIEGSQLKEGAHYVMIVNKGQKRRITELRVIP
jgi:hypothetical protein